MSSWPRKCKSPSMKVYYIIIETCTYLDFSSRELPESHLRSELVSSHWTWRPHIDHFQPQGLCQYHSPQYQYQVDCNTASHSPQVDICWQTDHDLVHSCFWEWCIFRYCACEYIWSKYKQSKFNDMIWQMWVDSGCASTIQIAILHKRYKFQ